VWRWGIVVAQMRISNCIFFLHFLAPKSNEQQKKKRERERERGEEEEGGKGPYAFGFLFNQLPQIQVSIHKIINKEPHF